MAPCPCTLNRPAISPSEVGSGPPLLNCSNIKANGIVQWPWVVTYLEWKKGAIKRTGSGRPALYPRCAHGKTINTFTDGSPTVPLELKPSYSKRKSKEGAAVREASPPLPQRRKRKAEHEQPQTPQAPCLGQRVVVAEEESQIQSQSDDDLAGFLRPARQKCSKGALKHKKSRTEKVDLTILSDPLARAEKVFAREAPSLGENSLLWQKVQSHYSQSKG